MAFSRRDLFKVGGVGAAALAMSGCTAASGPAAPSLMGASKGKRVVVIGAGFGGLTVAKELRKASKDIEVVVLEKRDNFMSCPYSNTWLGGCMDFTDKKPVTLDTLSYDFYAPAMKHGYHFVQCEVTAIDRSSKTVTTTKGAVNYDYLVITGGIEYDYTKIAGTDKALASQLLMDCPPALRPGSEHIRLKKQLEELEEGNVIITVPDGAYRCPPAPYERAAMIANYIKNNKIKAKVLILDPKEKPGAKPKQFMAVYNELYKDIIEFHGNCALKSVNLAKKEVTVSVGTETKVDKVIPYSVANIIVKNVGSPLMKMAGIKTNGDGYASVKLPLHCGLNQDGSADTSVFVLGDAIAATNFAAGSGYPKSGHMANSQGKIVAKQLVNRILARPIDDMILPDNTCFSMVASNPKEAIVVNHRVEYIQEDVKDADGKVSKVGKIKVNVSAKGENAADRPALGKATDDWYRGIMNDLFS